MAPKSASKPALLGSNLNDCLMQMPDGSLRVRGVDEFTNDEWEPNTYICHFTSRVRCLTPSLSRARCCHTPPVVPSDHA